MSVRFGAAGVPPAASSECALLPLRFMMSISSSVMSTPSKLSAAVTSEKHVRHTCIPVRRTTALPFADALVVEFAMNSTHWNPTAAQAGRTDCSAAFFCARQQQEAANAASVTAHRGEKVDFRTFPCAESLYGRLRLPNPNLAQTHLGTPPRSVPTVEPSHAHFQP